MAGVRVVDDAIEHDLASPPEQAMVSIDVMEVDPSPIRTFP